MVFNDIFLLYQILNNILLTEVLRNSVSNPCNTVLFSHLYYIHVINECYLPCSSPEVIQNALKIIQENTPKLSIPDPEVTYKEIACDIIIFLGFINGVRRIMS